MLETQHNLEQPIQDNDNAISNTVAGPTVDWTSRLFLDDATLFQQSVQNLAWDKTSVGPIRKWPRELRQMVRLMMTDVNPIILYWGEENTVIYNEAYVPLVGDKHPLLQGMDARDAFPDFWDYFDAIISEIKFTGKAQVGEASMLLMQRHGFLEETYFDWKLLPVLCDDGVVRGTYGMPSDSTMACITTRRSEMVEKLSRATGMVNTLEEMWKATIDGLSQNERDIPFAMLYANNHHSKGGSPFQADSKTFQLKGAIGIDASHPTAASIVDMGEASTGFAAVMAEALTCGATVHINADDPRLPRGCLEKIEWKGFGVPCRQFAVVPISTGTRTAAILIVGLNPRRRYNQAYQNFLQLVADVLAPQVSKLRLSEELRSRAELARQVMQDFEQSEMRFSRFAARSVVGLAVTDLDGRVLYANEAWYNFSGGPQNNDEQNSKSWLDSVTDEDKRIAEQFWHNVAVLKESGTFQFRSKVPFMSGQMIMPYKTGICACYADLDEGGEVETVMCLIVDISELKWTEEQLTRRTHELETSELKYRNFSEHSPLGIVRTDELGNVQFGNDAWHDFYGFKKGDNFGPQPWVPYMLPDDRPRVIEFFDKLAEQPGVLSVELRLVKRFSITEGDRVIESDAWILATGVSEADQTGKVAHVDFWVTDISSQKMAAKVLGDKMEEAVRMRAQQERFMDMISHEIRNPLSACLSCSEQVIESMEHCITTMDVFPSSNEASLKQLDVQQLMRRHVDSALEAANTIMYCVQHQKQIVDDVLTLSKLDSDLLVVSPVPVEPLNLVKSSLKIFEPELRMSDISLNIIEHESMRRLGVEWIMLDPNRFLQIVINLITNAIKFTRKSSTRVIDVTVSAEAQRPTTSGDKIDFVPQRYAQYKRDPAIVERDFRVTDEPIYLCMSVRDTGKGLTNDEKSLLFNRFAQASPKTHVEYGGSGLGLFISRQITEMLGGRIGISNACEQGCKFAFFVETVKIKPPEQGVTHTGRLIPNLERATSAPAQPFSRTKGKNKRTLSQEKAKLTKTITEALSRRVLVVEDNLVNQKVLCKQLKSRGFTVEAANHGKEALDAFERCQKCEGGNSLKFDVVLMDIEMPICSGIEAVTEIRRLEEAGHFLPHTPILGVTANVRSSQVDTAMAAGMDGVTTKPYRIDELIAHIDRVCPAVDQND